MHISYSGVIAPYTYNCPHAHKLKNVLRVKFEPKVESEPDDEPKELSKRQQGIDLHEEVAAYIKGDIEEFELITDTIERVKDSPIAEVEVQEFYSVDLAYLESKPEKGDYVSTRKDAVIRDLDRTEILDWKFGTPDYAIAKHIDELEFFLACEAAINPNVGEWIITIHFPEIDYTVPREPYDYRKVAKLQKRYIDRIDLILNDKYWRPNPSRANCRFCNYRSSDTGGSGHCDHSVI
jgi:hypothetical protein